jgi:hypothetical protein
MRSVTADRSSCRRSARCCCAGDTSFGDRPIVEEYSARERALCGDRDGAIPLMRAAADQLFREGQLLAWGVPATGVLIWEELCQVGRVKRRPQPSLRPPLR